MRSAHVSLVSPLSACSACSGSRAGRIQKDTSGHLMHTAIIAALDVQGVH